MTSPSEWISLLVENAEALRKAGVTRITLGDCSVEMAPYAAPPRRDEMQAGGDPLFDADTFGARGVPGYSRLRDTD